MQVFYSQMCDLIKLGLNGRVFQCPPVRAPLSWVGLISALVVRAINRIREKCATANGHAACLCRSSRADYIINKKHLPSLGDRSREIETEFLGLGLFTSELSRV